MIDTAVVRAIDVGYGNVKFVLKHLNMIDPVKCDKFPSSAPVSNEQDLGAGLMSKRNTVHVDVGGVRYEVGPDVELAQGVFDETSILDEDFVVSDGYMARSIGALHYMATGNSPRLEYIDLLVLGLPISTYESRKDQLKVRMQGQHVLPDGHIINVKRVEVFPQPLGAFFNHMYVEETKEKSTELLKQMNLIVDPGFFTFDWLLAKGMKPLNKRSGTVNRGMSAIVKAIAEDVAKDFKTNPGSVFRIIDTAIRENRQPRIFNEVIDMEKYMPRAKPIVTEALSALSNSVGDGVDIDNIILVGGGAQTYLKELKNKFSRHNVITSENAVYANVTGFQLAGERHMMSERVKAQKAKA